MTGKQLYILLFTVLVISFSFAETVPDEYRIKNISTQKGLSRTTVMDILQDSDGFLWFATANGLNKFDGYSFTVYTDSETEKLSISDKGVIDIYEDSDGIIWIGLFDGKLNKFDRKQSKIDVINITSPDEEVPTITTNYYAGPLLFSRMGPNSITSLKEDKFGNIWVGTWGNGIKIYRKSTGELLHINADFNDDGLHSNRILDITADSRGNMFLATFGGGLNKIFLHHDPFSEGFIFRFDRYDPIIDRSNGESLYLNTLHISGDSLLWIGTNSVGLYSFDISGRSQTKVFTHYNNISNSANRLNSSNIVSITEDGSGNLWLGTFGGGLTKFNPDENTWFTFRHDSQLPNTIADDEILSVFADNSGIIWVGAHLAQGISKIYKVEKKFEQINRQYPDKGLNDNVVWEVYTEDSNIFWFGTYKGGLNKYNRKENKFEYILRDPDNPYSLSDNHVRAITGDGRSLWIGTYRGGLNRYDKASGKFYTYTFDQNDSSSIGGNQVVDIYIDSNQTCWVATFGGGLNKFLLSDAYDGDNKISFTRYQYNESDSTSIPGNNVYTIMEGSDKHLWIGTFGAGLTRFNRETEEFESYRHIPEDIHSLSDDRVMAIHEDQNGYIWAGTYGGGLNKFDRESGRFIRYNESNGFYSNVIYGILEDDRNNLWLSSDNGIIKLNYNIYYISYFDMNDGLLSMEFSGGAYSKTPDGEMFFGGINGVNHFYPQNISQFFQTVPIAITSFKVFNKPVVGQQEEIQISYSQNFFTVEFAVLDYNEESNYKYSYKLDGLDQDWHQAAAGVRSVSYANLAPGYYKFRVRAVNRFGVWNTEEDNISIVIHPPFWYTWWFIALGIFGLISVISLAFKLRFDHLLAIERIKSKLAADLHDNIGAGLTEISILSELTSVELKKDSPAISKRMSTLSDTARSLIDSMSDIVWMVNPKRDTLKDLLIRLKDSYSDLLSELGVAFRISSHDGLDQLKLNMDYKQNLFLIFKEGIHNCIKHSQCSKIELVAKISGDILVLSLKDNGQGLNDVRETTGNGIKNMKSRAELIGGEVTFRSAANYGTEIIFRGKFSKLKRLKSIFNNI
ncbi:MAG: hypothetical protein SCALA702_19910 [Melioribacteraceae bacterium]|nr:MAG: hypothetical protein SCALA702_19910 [Melioribacteraceae bacterium]